MKEQIKWKFYEKRWEFRDFYFDKILRRHIFEKFFKFEPKIYFYGGKRLHRINKTNDIIKKAILSEQPFMVSRFGNTEIHVINCIIRNRLLGSSNENSLQFKKWFGRLSTLSGFFPERKELAEQFTDLMLNSCKEINLLGMWHRPMEDYFVRMYMKNAEITYLRWLEPWYCKHPWTEALKGKKVLVIHPFEKSIIKQYEKREKIFPGTEILPAFELKVLKAVQTSAGGIDDRFGDWFDALEYMYKEAIDIDFDVAIIGCGAYGMPLAAKLKKAGKIAIHLGGVTQILFGIKGRRWVESPIDKKIPFNDDWVYPDIDETPKSAGSVENGCYWDFTTKE